jgi:CheY-like chemotaxis protein
VALALCEPFSVYLDSAQPLPAADLWLPTVHPIDQPWFGSAPPETSVEFVGNVVGELETRSRLPVLVKETGLPSGPSADGFDESRQAAFWSRARMDGYEVARHLRKQASLKSSLLVALTGYGLPADKKRAREAHFGLFRADGSAKPALAVVPEVTR